MASRGPPQPLHTINLQCTPSWCAKITKPTVTLYKSLLLSPGDMDIKFIVLSALFPQNHTQALKAGLVIWEEVAWLPLGLKQSHRFRVLITVSLRLPAVLD